MKEHIASARIKPSQENTSQRGKIHKLPTGSFYSFFFSIILLSPTSEMVQELTQTHSKTRI